ncbi:MAG: hypothetical protein AAFQ36_09370 [Pseudomonadota bacterium]
MTDWRKSKGFQVYRMRASSGALIYVGSSGQSLVRFQGHQSQSDWFGEVVTIEVEHFGSRLDAQIAEIEAILSEEPRENSLHPKAREMLAALKKRREAAPKTTTISELNRSVPDTEIRTEASGYNRRGKTQNEEGRP